MQKHEWDRHAIKKKGQDDYFHMSPEKTDI